MKAWMRLENGVTNRGGSNLAFVEIVEGAGSSAGKKRRLNLLQNSQTCSLKGKGTGKRGGAPQHG